VFESLTAGNGNVKTYYLPTVDTRAHDFDFELVRIPFYILGTANQLEEVFRLDRSIYALPQLVLAVVIVAHTKQGKFRDNSPFHCIISSFLLYARVVGLACYVILELAFSFIFI
jgi:hypothetical protein